MTKISTVIITVGLISTVVLLLSLSLWNISSKYGITYSNSSMSSFNKMEKLQNISRDTKSNMTSITDTTNPASNLDAFFSAGYNVLKMLIVSGDIATDTGSAVINTIPQTDNKGEIQTILTGFLIILIVGLIVIGVILKTLLKTDV